jgi:hypothetical protein
MNSDSYTNTLGAQPNQDPLQSSHEIAKSIDAEQLIKPGKGTPKTADESLVAGCITTTNNSSQDQMQPTMKSKKLHEIPLDELKKVLDSKEREIATKNRLKCPPSTTKEIEIFNRRTRIDYNPSLAKR